MAIMQEPLSGRPVVHGRDTTLDELGRGYAPLAPVSAAPAPAASGARVDASLIQRRILILDHTATMGGGEIALLNLVTHLDPLRFDPMVVLCSDGPLTAALRERGIETR